MTFDAILSTRPDQVLELDGRYRCTPVETATGRFAVGTWDGGTSPVVALHGISSNHLLWAWAADADPDLHLIAPDLRGRGDSTTDGPFGLRRHRDDVLALLDVLGLDRVVLAGMSLGGFVATAVAAAVPDRVSGVVLVDGGMPFLLPEGTRHATAEITARGATDTPFASVADYAATYFALLGDDLDQDDPTMRAFMGHNLRQDGDGLRVKMPSAALREDARDVFGAAPVGAWLAALAMPVHLLHDASPAVPVDAAGWAARLPAMTARAVEGVDHATIVMGPRGGALTAEAIRSVL